MTDRQRVEQLDALMSHVWMVRTFIKHSEEAEEDDDLSQVHRTLYDVAHALGPALAEQNWEKYLKLLRKKLGKLRAATQQFLELQPEVSTHTNFQMAAHSLRAAVEQIAQLLETSRAQKEAAG